MMSKHWWWVLLIVGLVAFASLLLPTSTAQGKGDAALRDAVADHGTNPEGTVLPALALDSEVVPNLVIKPDDAEKSLPVYEVVKNTFMFFGNIAEVDEYNRGSNANAGFVVTPDGVVVFDSLGSPLLGRRLIATVKSKTDQPIRYLILTHNHPDHAYGSSAFSGIAGLQVIGAKGMLEYINSERMDSSVAYRNTFIAEDMKDFSFLPPTVLIEGEAFSSQVVELGGEVFEVYGIGDVHSDGDLVVYQKNAKVLWVSDLVFNQRVTFIADGHSKSILEAQAWLRSTFPEAEVMIPGHGSAQTRPFPMLAKTENYIRGLRQRMGDAVENDVELQDAVDAGDFPDWQSVRMYDLNHRKNLSFVYTEMESDLF